MDGSTSTSTSSVKDQGIGRISDKRNFISVLWKIKIQLATASAAATIYQRCHYVCVKCALSYVSRAEEVMIECDIHHTRSIKTNSGVNLSRKPGLDLCWDLLQHYLQGVPLTCSFWVFTSYTYIDFARLITQIVFYMKCNQIQSIIVLCGWQLLLNFVLFCSTCNSSIMHILPLPPCGLYSIRAQNGYGQHRPCRPVDPGNTQGSHRPISFMRNKHRTRANGLP